MGRDTCQRNKRASPPTSETPVGKSCPPSSSLRRDDPGGKIESIFPGSTVVKALCYPCRGRGFDPWSGNKIPHGQKKKNERERGSWKTLVCRGEPCLLAPPSLSCGAKSSQSCPTLCDPMDSSTPGTADHGILQARILE